MCGGKETFYACRVLCSPLIGSSLKRDERYIIVAGLRAPRTHRNSLALAPLCTHSETRTRARPVAGLGALESRTKVSSMGHLSGWRCRPQAYEAPCAFLRNVVSWGRREGLWERKDPPPGRLALGQVPAGRGPSETDIDPSKAPRALSPLRNLHVPLIMSPG